MKQIFTILACLTLSFQQVFAQDKSTIAVFDLKDFKNESTREEFITKLRNALHMDGFFALKNTGVNNEIINKAYCVMKKYFALPIEKKLLDIRPAVNEQRGYSVLEAHTVKDKFKGVVKEFYTVGPLDVTGPWANVWTDHMDLRSPLTSFYSELDMHAGTIMEIFSVALGEDLDFLRREGNGRHCTGRVLHYTADESNYDDETIWLRAHTDFGLFTILPRATHKGLEVCDRNGVWKPVYVNEEAFVINCGDLMSVFSNGYFLSAMHRVKKPEEATEDRYSTLMFVHSHPESILYPLPRWIEQVGEKRFCEAKSENMLFEGLASINLANNELLKTLSESGLLERMIDIGQEKKATLENVVRAGFGSEKVKQRLQELQQ